jgi:hypothetical protein
MALVQTHPHIPPILNLSCLRGFSAVLTTGVAALAITSAAPMAISQTQLGGAECVWCYASAGLSAGLFVALLWWRRICILSLSSRLYHTVDADSFAQFLQGWQRV